MSETSPSRTPTMWQEADGWHVRVRQDGAVTVFATRDEAISYSTSTFTDGATPAQAVAMLCRPRHRRRTAFNLPDPRVGA